MDQFNLIRSTPTDTHFGVESLGCFFHSESRLNFNTGSTPDMKLCPELCPEEESHLGVIQTNVSLRIASQFPAQSPHNTRLILRYVFVSSLALTLFVQQGQGQQDMLAKHNENSPFC